MVFGGKCDYAGPCLVQANVMISNVSIQLRCTTHQPLQMLSVSMIGTRMKPVANACSHAHDRQPFVTFDALLN